MITFREHELHYLVDKYPLESEIGRIIWKFIIADEEYLDSGDYEHDCDPMSEEWSKAFEDRCMLQKRKYIEGIQKLRKVYKKQPENPDILALLGNAYHDIGNARLGIKCLQKALDHLIKQPIVERLLSEEKFMTLLAGMNNLRAYSMWLNSPEGREYEKWFSVYVKKKIFSELS